MNGLTRDILSLQSSTNLQGSARLTNFSPNLICFKISGSSAVTKDDLRKILISTNFKNSVGSGVAITNNCPLDMLADLTDYELGFGLLGDDKTVAIALPVGKYVLKSDDEITFNISTEGTLSQGLSLYMFAVDNFIGKEQMLNYKFVKCSATQVYQEPNVLSVYGQFTNPSDTIFMTVSDFFGSNNISESACATMGAILGHAEDYDNFGVVFHDRTGLSQNISVRSGSDNERLLMKCWVFDEKRLGYAVDSMNDVSLLANSIKNNDAVKYKCVSYFYGG